MKNLHIDGFSIIEAIVALAIFSIIISAILPLFITNLKMNTQSQAKSQAVAALTNTFDSIRMKPISDLPQTGISDYPDQTVGGKTYKVKVEFCKVSSQCTSSSRMVTINVFENDKVAATAETIFTEVNTSAN